MVSVTSSTGHKPRATTPAPIKTAVMIEIKAKKEPPTADIGTIVAKDVADLSIYVTEDGTLPDEHCKHSVNVVIPAC